MLHRQWTADVFRKCRSCWPVERSVAPEQCKLYRTGRHHAVGIRDIRHSAKTDNAEFPAFSLVELTLQESVRPATGSYLTMTSGKRNDAFPGDIRLGLIQCKKMF